MDTITPHLQRLFEKHRIVFWYDEKKELRQEFEFLNLPSVEKIELNDNEFMVKYRILREAPHTQFLLYKEGENPQVEDNWLLDVQLAYGVFRTDKIGLWASELGMEYHHYQFIEKHQEFFTRATRRDRLGEAKKKYTEEYTEKQLQMEMLGICCGTDPTLFSILEVLFSGLYSGNEDILRLINRCNLFEFLITLLQNEFSYQSKESGIKDFYISLIATLYNLQTGDEQVQGGLSQAILPFMSSWKNSIRSNASFEGLIAKAETELHLSDQLGKLSLDQLKVIDYFPTVDRFIIPQLISRITQKTLNLDNCIQILRQREKFYWYKNYEIIYHFILYAARFMKELGQADLSLRNTEEGIQRYVKTWYLLDQNYRKAVYYYQKSSEVTTLEPLREYIENHYTNSFLLTVNDNWQQVINTLDTWKFPNILQQQNFYHKIISRQHQQNRKAIVIISDALRYEVGEELNRKLLSLDKFEAEIKPMISMLPSYTQLGMAALLPHRTITLADDTAVSVLLDGKKVLGTEQRQAVLQAASNESAMAMRAEDLVNTDNYSLRELIRDHQLIYIYHNQIDSVGDKRDTENQTFTAVEKALEELILLVKKLTSANATQIFITADHGFLYQHNVLDSSDFIKDVPESSGITAKGRRFIIGRNLKEHASFRIFTSEQAGLTGDLQIKIPKSINRLRIKGSGSRYVHGGATLQEIIIPLITVKKLRTHTNRFVDIDILRNTGSTITSGQISITFYQKEPVSEKVKGRVLFAGFYHKGKKLVSNTVKLNCNFTSENPRDREIRETFIFTQEVNTLNGQKIDLVLSYEIEGTTYNQSYTESSFMVQRAFTSDFDF